MPVTTTWVLRYEGSDAFSRVIWQGVWGSEDRRDFRFTAPPNNEMKGSLVLTPYEHGLNGREDVLKFCAILLRSWKEAYVDGYMLTAQLPERSDRGYEPVVAMFDSLDKEMSGEAHSPIRFVNYMRWPELL